MSLLLSRLRALSAELCGDLPFRVVDAQAEATGVGVRRCVVVFADLAVGFFGFLC